MGSRSGSEGEQGLSSRGPRPSPGGPFSPRLTHCRGMCSPRCTHTAVPSRKPTHPIGCCLLLQATRAALAAEEPRGDRLQARLQELIVFPQDPQPLADSVVAAIQEHQRYRAGRGRSWTPRSGPLPVSHQLQRGLALSCCLITNSSCSYQRLAIIGSHWAQVLTPFRSILHSAPRKRPELCFFPCYVASSLISIKSPYAASHGGWVPYVMVQGEGFSLGQHCAPLADGGADVSTGPDFRPASTFLSAHGFGHGQVSSFLAQQRSADQISTGHSVNSESVPIFTT